MNGLVFFVFMFFENEIIVLTIKERSEYSWQKQKCISVVRIFL